jgi:hypothetical protein
LIEERLYRVPLKDDTADGVMLDVALAPVR